MVSKGFDVVTPDNWKSLIQHLKIHFEDHCWSNDGLYEELVYEFIIQVGDKMDESGDSDQSDSSDDEVLFFVFLLLSSGTVTKINYNSYLTDF